MKIANVIKNLSILMLSFFVVSTLVFADAKTAKTTKGTTKPTVVVVSSHSCPMCHEFENRVLNNSEVKKELNRFTLKKVNAGATRIQVDVTPTVVIYDRNNKQVKKFVPSLDKNKFVQILKQVE